MAPQSYSLADRTEPGSYVYTYKPSGRPGPGVELGQGMRRRALISTSRNSSLVSICQLVDSKPVSALRSGCASGKWRYEITGAFVTSGRDNLVGTNSC